MATLLTVGKARDFVVAHIMGWKTGDEMHCTCRDRMHHWHLPDTSTRLYGEEDDLSGSDEVFIRECLPWLRSEEIDLEIRILCASYGKEAVVEFVGWRLSRGAKQTVDANGETFADAGTKFIIEGEGKLW